MVRAITRIQITNNVPVVVHILNERSILILADQGVQQPCLFNIIVFAIDRIVTRGIDTNILVRNLTPGIHCVDASV